MCSISTRPFPVSSRPGGSFQVVSVVQERDEDQDPLFMAGQRRFAAQMENIDSWKLTGTYGVGLYCT